jgi:hypothetical protein
MGQSSNIWERHRENQSLIHEEINNMLNSGDACYHLEQNLLSSPLLPKKVKIKIYKIDFACLLYGSLALREELGLRVFENRVLRRIFGPKKDEMLGSWRKFYNEELHNLQSSPDIIRMVKSRRLRWPGHASTLGKKRNACRVLVGMPKGKRSL